MRKISGYNLGMGIVLFILGGWQLKIATIFSLLQAPWGCSLFLSVACFVFAVLNFHCAFREDKIKG